MKDWFIVAIAFILLTQSDAFASPHQYRRRGASSGSSSNALITYRAPRRGGGSSARASLRPVSTNPADYIARESTASHEFMKQTGYENGRPGYQIVYVVALRDGGLDAPSNMRWRRVQGGTQDKKSAEDPKKPGRSF